jgi:hypothetical protein
MYICIMKVLDWWVVHLGSWNGRRLEHRAQKQG